MLLFIGIYIIVFCVYFACPLPLRILIMAINFLLPDPIPIVDEVIMGAGIISKLLFLERLGELLSSAMDFIREHKKAVITIIIVMLLVWRFALKG